MPQSGDKYDPLDSAALYAYHATVDWGLLADEVGFTIFNSHWLIDKDWFRLPRVGWGEIGNKPELIHALTTAGLIDGELERYASRQREPTFFLKSVDDELVERLDGWRDQALRYARDSKGVDERLQNLYAQLFVLRTVEDRGLQQDVPPVAFISIGSETIDRLKWLELLEVARRRIGGGLFDQDYSSGIPDHVFAGVINDLYTPKSLPGEHSRYDFSWIEADVLGLAYEKYLATILQPAPVAPQYELFATP